MTKLSPMEETLFRVWAKAHGVDNFDDPSNYFDHRGLYKQSNGLIQPRGVVPSIAQAHNEAMETQDEQSGDMTFPDPYAAQAEMHGNMVKAQSDSRRDQMKMQMEKEKLAHTSQEKEKDRQHKLMLEQMKQQQRQQEQEQQRQARAQEAEAMRQSRAQEAEANRQAQAKESEASRQHGMQTAVMQEGFERSRPQPEVTPNGPDPMGGPQPEQAPTQGTNSMSGGSGNLQEVLFNRALGR